MNDHIPNVTKMISDTPRTDAVYFKQGATMYDLANEMKLVERELNAANAEIEEKRKDVVWLATEKAKLENYVMRLEEAGDALYGNCDPSRWDSTATAARKVSDQNAWLEAKEAKL